jgi:Flp pilus assembly protein TadD/SAM-dependent methyltransferase
MEDTTARAWRKQSYYDIYLHHRGFVSSKWTHYPLIYDEILGRHLDAGKPLVLLEIGVQNGGSLEIWKKYLPPGSEVHGMDINPRCLELDFGAGIHFHHGNATDIDLVNKLFSGKRFDIIVDDGSHVCQDVISTFINLFKNLNAGGVYLVEDLHASYYTHGDYRGGLLRAGSSVEFFKRFVDALHFDYIAADERSSIADFTPFLSIYRQQIASICFHDSICAIRKFSQPRQDHFHPLTSGETYHVDNINRQREWKNHIANIDAAKAMYAVTAARPADGESTSAALLSQGMEAFNFGCFEQASAIFSGLFHQRPDDPMPSAYLAFICARQGLIDGARDFIARALEIAPTRVDLQAALGEVFLTAGQAGTAAEYLQEAVAARPDLWTAYPALARSLVQSGRGAEAVALLDGAALAASGAQADIRQTLLEILAERGDIAAFTRANLRFSSDIGADLRAVSDLAHFDADPGRLIATLEKIQHQYLAGLLPSLPAPRRGGDSPTVPIHLAFLAGDLHSEIQTGRLTALLRHLPVQDFVTTLLIGDPDVHVTLGGNDACNLCLILADHSVLLSWESDAAALASIHKLAPDVLIDLDAYSARERLSVFARAELPRKLIWGEAPMPPLWPECRALVGAALGVDAELPCVTLPGLGEVFEFPEWAAGEAETRPAPLVWACLTPAARIGAQGWRLFAQVLDAAPSSTLLINLHDLGAAGEEFIAGQFAAAGIARERLGFVHAERGDELCQCWKQADFGLAPPVDAGGMALPAALWMGRPYIALRSFLPWSRRPAAFLEAVGAAQWIADDEEAYVALARRLAEGGRRAPDAALRARMAALGLNDAAAFAQGFAAALRGFVADGGAGS